MKKSVVSLVIVSLLSGPLFVSHVQAVTYNDPVTVDSSESAASSSDSTIEKPENNSESSESVTEVNEAKPEIKQSTSEEIIKEEKGTDETEAALKPDSSVGPGYYSQEFNMAGSTRNKRSLDSYNMNPFLANIKQGSLNGWHTYRILPSISAAQAVLESGWGKSQLAILGNNLFGIKGSYKGQSILFPTLEYIDGKWITVNAEFRKYPSWHESVEDHGVFFHENPRYHNLIGVEDYVKVANLLSQDGYATDPDYASKIISTIRANNLDNWDREVLGGPQKAVVISPFNESESLTRLNEFKQAFPSYASGAFLRQLPGGTQYELVVQPFNRDEIDDRFDEIDSSFPGWAKTIEEIRDVSTRKGVLIAPFNGKEAGERFLELKKTGYSMSLTTPYSTATDSRQKAVVISPFNEKEALDKLIEFRQAFPSYAAGAFLRQLPNGKQYELVIQPFTNAEIMTRFAEINKRFPGWMKSIKDAQDVSAQQGVMIRPFTGQEVAEKLLSIKQQTGYISKIVD